MQKRTIGQPDSNKRGGKYFLFILGIFTLLILIPLSAVGVSAFVIGEITPHEEILEFQNNSAIPVIYRPAFMRSDILQYKLVATLVNDPDLLIMGSSRMLSFRSEFANLNPDRFYNAAAPTMSIGEELSFLQYILAHNVVPDLIILGIDFPQFSQEGFYRESNVQVQEPGIGDYFNRLKQGYGIVLGEWVLGNMPGYLNKIQTDSAIWLGVQAHQFHVGFLPDGSQYHDELRSAEFEDKLEIHIRNFENRQQMFATGRQADPETLAELNTFLDLAQENGIEVIGLLPAYHPVIYEPMMQSSDFAYVSEARIAISESFSEHGYSLFDFSDPSSFGGSAQDLRDGWHSSEPGSLRMYLGLLQGRSDLLSEFSDADGLEADLNNAPNLLQVYPLSPN